jgi:hypothetical protein
MKLKCIKGIADVDNIHVVCLVGDVVELIETEEGGVSMEGWSGWCKGIELYLTPQQVAESFSSCLFVK